MGEDGVDPTGVRPQGDSSLGGDGRTGRARTFRRLSGLDRSGPPPSETVAGAPLHPWTIPNLIGFTRIALIPVFLAFAMSSDDGTDKTAAVLYFVIGWSDYADGFAARLTGQYSRLGTLLDPLTDRLLILSGVVVCWHFELLPRWALAIMAAREVFMLVLVRYGLNKGADIKVNWPGRIAVAPVMGSIFFAIASVDWLAEPLLYVGLVLALWATVLYVQDGFRLSREVSTRA